MNLNLLLEKEVEEIKEAIESENLNEDTKAALVKLEMESENPREDLMEFLGYSKPIDPESDDGEPVLDMNKPFSMVHHDGLKHYLQNNCIFDRGSKKLIKDCNK